MPCRDEWTSGGGYSDCSHVERRADQNARVACSVLRTLSKEAISKLPKETQVWWAEHQEVDRRREKAEEERRQLAWKKEAAKAKLTKEERKLLGL